MELSVFLRQRLAETGLSDVMSGGIPSKLQLTADRIEALDAAVSTVSGIITSHRIQVGVCLFSRACCLWAFTCRVDCRVALSWTE